MLKVYIAAGLATVIFLGGWNGRGWYEDSLEKNVIINKVEERNDVIEEVDKTTTVVEKIIYRDREKIVRLPAVDTGIVCPIVELTQLRNEAYGSLDPLLFQGED